MISPIARICAGAVALTALAGLVVQFHATLGNSGSVIGALWILVRFFTVLANLAILVVFAVVATNRGLVTPHVMGGATLSILLVGVVYGLLLRGILSLSGGALLADALLHKATPLLVPLWWIAFARKGALAWRDPWIWALFPLAYLFYALARGMAEGIYAYPFINLAKIGWNGVALNSVAIAAGFLVAGHALVWLDQRMGSKTI